RAAALVGRRVEDLIVHRVHHQIVGSGVIVHLEHLRPRLAGVSRLVDAALAARPPQAAGRGHEHDVVVPRIDQDAVDVARRRKAHARPGLAAVDRLVDAVAPRCALAVVRLAGANPHEIGVALRHGDVADPDQTLILELRLEGRAAVGRLPHAAVGGADVVNRRVRFVDGEIGDPPGHGRRADRPEVQRVEWTAAGDGSRGGRLLGSTDEGLRAESGDERGDEREDSNRFHGWLRLRMTGAGTIRFWGAGPTEAHVTTRDWFTPGLAKLQTPPGNTVRSRCRAAAGEAGGE